MVTYLKFPRKNENFRLTLTLTLDFGSSDIPTIFNCSVVLDIIPTQLDQDLLSSLF